ncbi:MAG TPA: hypothetical protein VK871_08145 [Candidatus Limnocylindrales bacterium]|nr:hypothetical protein [Candidatus Limnocylindrales bacterium]
MDQLARARTASDAAVPERPIHLACLVAGCPCRAERIVPTRSVAVIGVAASANGKSAGQDRSPEPAWRFVGLPVA